MPNIRKRYVAAHSASAPALTGTRKTVNSARCRTMNGADFSQPGKRETRGRDSQGWPAASFGVETAGAVGRRSKVMVLGPYPSGGEEGGRVRCHSGKTISGLGVGEVRSRAG